MFRLLFIQMFEITKWSTHEACSPEHSLHAGSTPAISTTYKTWYIRFMNRTSKSHYISDEKRPTYTKQIISFFQNERNEEIGIVAAEDLLHFFLEIVGKDIYKKSITDSKKLLKQRIEDFEMELDLLVDK